MTIAIIDGRSSKPVIIGAGADVASTLVLQAESAATAAASSATVASDILATAQDAIGHWVDAEPTITNGRFDKDTGVFTSDSNYRAYELTRGIENKLRIVRILQASSLTAAGAFFDDAGDIIGDPIQPGPESGFVYDEDIALEWPAGAVTFKGTAWASEQTVGGVSRKGGMIIERLVIDEARAADVQEVIASKPYVLQEWSPATGYYFRNGQVYATSGWFYQVYPIEPGQAVIVNNGVKAGDPSGVLFGGQYDEETGTFGNVTGSFETDAGGDPGEPMSPVARVAPAGTTHVAVSIYRSRDVQVWISQPDSSTMRDASRLLAIMNPFRGKTILWDGDSLAQGGGVTGSVPAQVAANLSAILNNRAIGGSSPTNGYYYLREGEDTIGLTGLDYSSVRVLRGPSLAELAQRRTDWASFWRARIPNAPDTISDDEYAVWTAASYENSLVPYLDDADFMVTNHAHNAAPACPSATGWTTFTGALTGTGIGDGVLTISSVTGVVQFPQRIFTGSAFDETGDTGLFIGEQLTGTSGGAGTYRVLGTWSGTISSTAMTGRPYNFAWNDTLLTIPGPGGTAGHTSADPMDRGYYVGAMRFMFNLWYSAQSGEGWRRPLIIAGHDQYDQKPNVCLAQELMHTLTRHPILRVWEHTGFSQNKLTASPYADKTIKQAWFTTTDPLHEFEDTSGRATRHLANIHTSLMLQAATGA